MDWKPYLEAQVAQHYPVTEELFKLLTDADLDWKPASGSNWMTVGQLLEHIVGCGGASFKGIADGSFAEMPPEVAEGGPDAGLPPAEALPSVASVAEALEKLAADRKLAEEVLAGISEEDLESKPAPVWWDPRSVPTGRRLMGMILHLFQHKSQLYYYIKLMGRDVNTGHLWGM